MSKRSRDKGNRFERKVAKLFRDALGGDERIKRMWQRQQGHGNPDVWVPGLHTEAKCGKRPNPVKALYQALTDSGGHGVPVAILHYDAIPGERKSVETATLFLDDFLAMYAELEDWRQGE